MGNNAPYTREPKKIALTGSWNIDDASWDFWMKPDPKTGKSRYESWDFPMDKDDYWATSMNFGDGRPNGRSHAGLDILGHGGAGSSNKKGKGTAIGLKRLRMER